jgi:hypothetical protein
LPPDSAQIAQGREGVRDGFGQDLEKAKTAFARKELAQRMLQVAKLPNQSAEYRWALFECARNLAVVNGDVPLCIQTLDDFTKVFNVNRAEIVSETAEKLWKTVPVARSGPLFELIEKTADTAVKVDDYKSAMQLFSLGNRLAQSTKDAWLVNRFDSRWRRTKALAKDYGDVNDDDERMGRFLCFRKNDWNLGLLLLDKSTDAELSAVVKKDLKDPTQAKDRIALGESWMELAEKAKDPEKAGYLRRAYHWFRLGIEGQTGLNKARIENRMSMAAEAIESVDVNEDRVTLYEGHWTAVYDDGSRRWDYTILPNGEATISNSKDRDGRKSFLYRKNGVVFFVWEDVIERITCQGNSLVLERFWSKDFPRKTHSTGVAVFKP